MIQQVGRCCRGKVSNVVCACCLHVFYFDLPNTNAHILSVTYTTGLFSESGRLNDAVELERLALGLVLPVVRVRAVGIKTLSLSGSFAEDAAPPPSQLHIAQGHGPPQTADRTILIPLDQRSRRCLRVSFSNQSASSSTPHRIAHLANACMPRQFCIAP